MGKQFLASLETLYKMLSFVREEASSFGFSEDELSQIELATEEALVNIVCYGYPDKQGNIFIECEKIGVDPKGLRVIIKDDGIPYNPLGNVKNQKHRMHIDSKIGGYGILFMLKLMDKVEYQRHKDQNILFLIKYKF